MTTKPARYDNDYWTWRDHGEVVEVLEGRVVRASIPVADGEPISETLASRERIDARGMAIRFCDFYNMRRLLEKRRKASFVSTFVVHPGLGLHSCKSCQAETNDRVWIRDVGTYCRACAVTMKTSLVSAFGDLTNEPVFSNEPIPAAIRLVASMFQFVDYMKGWIPDDRPGDSKSMKELSAKHRQMVEAAKSKLKAALESFEATA